MTKKRYIFILFLMATLLAVDVKAQDTGNINPQTSTEKGNAIFRTVSMWPVEFLRLMAHVGIYDRWKPEKGARENLDSHYTAESTLPIAREATFTQFLDGNEYWDSRVPPAFPLNAEKRRDIAKFALALKGNYTPSIFDCSENKNPKGSSPTFRCDGFVEYVYEQMGVNGGQGLFSDEEEQHCVLTFNPVALWNRLIKDPHLEGPKIAILDTSADGNSISVSASDTDFGSGLAVLEIWRGAPDVNESGKRAGTLIKKITEDYEVKHEYTFDEIGNVYEKGEGLVYARAFDQAGNYRTAVLIPAVKSVSFFLAEGKQQVINGLAAHKIMQAHRNSSEPASAAGEDDKNWVGVSGFGLC